MTPPVNGNISDSVIEFHKRSARIHKIIFLIYTCNVLGNMKSHRYWKELSFFIKQNCNFSLFFLYIQLHEGGILRKNPCRELMKIVISRADDSYELHFSPGKLARLVPAKHDCDSDGI